MAKWRISEMMDGSFTIEKRIMKSHYPLGNFFRETIYYVWQHERGLDGLALHLLTLADAKKYISDRKAYLKTIEDSYIVKSIIWQDEDKSVP